MDELVENITSCTVAYQSLTQVFGFLKGQQKTKILHL